MKKYILSIVFILLLLPAFSYGADFIPFGTPMPYDGVCMKEDDAKELVTFIDDALIDKKEITLKNDRIKTLEDINETMKKERDVYKKGYEEMKKMVDDQIALTKQTSEQCKEIVKHSKPTLMQDVGKVGIGVLIGIGLALLL